MISAFHRAEEIVEYCVHVSIAVGDDAWAHQCAEKFASAFGRPVSPAPVIQYRRRPASGPASEAGDQPWRELREGDHRFTRVIRDAVRLGVSGQYKDALAPLYTLYEEGGDAKWEVGKWRALFDPSWFWLVANQAVSLLLEDASDEEFASSLACSIGDAGLLASLPKILNESDAKTRCVWLYGTLRNAIEKNSIETMLWCLAQLEAIPGGLRQAERSVGFGAPIERVAVERMSDVALSRVLQTQTNLFTVLPTIEDFEREPRTPGELTDALRHAAGELFSAKRSNTRDDQYGAPDLLAWLTFATCRHANVMISEELLADCFGRLGEPVFSSVKTEVKRLAIASGDEDLINQFTGWQASELDHETVQYAIDWHCSLWTTGHKVDCARFWRFLIGSLSEIGDHHVRVAEILFGELCRIHDGAEYLRQCDREVRHLIRNTEAPIDVLYRVEDAARYGNMEFVKQIARLVLDE